MTLKNNTFNNESRTLIGTDLPVSLKLNSMKDIDAKQNQVNDLQRIKVSKIRKKYEEYVKNESTKTKSKIEFKTDYQNIIQPSKGNFIHGVDIISLISVYNFLGTVELNIRIKLENEKIQIHIKTELNSTKSINMNLKSAEGRLLELIKHIKFSKKIFRKFLEMYLKDFFKNTKTNIDFKKLVAEYNFDYESYDFTVLSEFK